MSFNPKMIALARESRGVTQTDMAAQMCVRQGTISKVESGDIETGEELEKSLVRYLRYPRGFFEQTDAIYPFGSSSFYHRKQQSVPNPILRKIEAKVNIYRFDVQRLLKSTDMHLRNRFKRIDIEEHPGEIPSIAGLVRATWRIPPGPVP